MSYLKMSLLIFLTLFCGKTIEASAAPPPLNPLCQKIFQKHPDFSGEMLIAKQDNILCQVVQGYTDHTKKTPLKLNEAFNIASLSKPMTAQTILLLHQQKKLDIEHTVQKYLTEFPYPQVRIKHLLQHTSGLSDYMTLAEKHPPKVKLLTNKNILDLLKKHHPPLQFSPGTQFKYSNTGYAVLASLAEYVSEQPFSALLKSTLFDKAQMPHSFVLTPNNAPKIKGWKLKQGKPEPYDLGWFDGVVGDGNVYASAGDLLNWQQALHGAHLISSDTLKMMFTENNLPSGEGTEYGAGWVVQDQGKIVWHSGSWVGFNSFLWRYRPQNLTVILLNNNGESDLQAIFSEVMDALNES